MSSDGDGYLEMNRAVDSIRIGARHRIDLGDIQELADSIALLGLLQPITISPDGTLICGLRRLAAVKLLGWKHVNVWVRSGISSELERLLAEQHENELRKPYTVVEAAGLYAELKRYQEEDAARRQEATRFGGVGNFPTPRGRAAAQAAEAIPGAPSYKTMDRVLEVQRAAADERLDPVVRALAEREFDALQHDGKVDPHYRVVRAATDIPAAELRHLHAVGDPVEELQAAAREAVARATAARRRPRALEPATADARRYEPRALLMTLEETDGWWDHYDPGEVARDFTAEQWDRLEGWVGHAIAFRADARRQRAAARPSA